MPELLLTPIPLARDARRYIVHEPTGKYWCYHYADEAYARETCNRLYEDWQNNDLQKQRDLHANFVVDIEDVVPSIH